MGRGGEADACVLITRSTSGQRGQATTVKFQAGFSREAPEPSVLLRGLGEDQSAHCCSDKAPGDVLHPATLR